MFRFKNSDQNYLKVLLQNWPSTNAELTGHRVGLSSTGGEASWLLVMGALPISN